MAKLFENRTGYAYFNGNPSKTGKRVTVEVTIMLDPVKGSFHSIEDHIGELFRHPYVQSIKIPDSED